MDEPRLIRTPRQTATGAISKKPGFLYSICGIGIAETSNVYTIYDGHSTAGEVKMRLVAGSYDSDFRLFACPMYFTQGLYVEFTTNGEEVTVQYLELAR
jgi:hypothetical protein